MSNIASAIKNEILRLAKRVVREYVAPIQSATTAHRKQLAALKKQLQELQRQVSQLQRAAGKNKPPVEAPVGDTQFRFTAKGFQSLRKRLGLTAEELGKLIDVDKQTIYKWEGESSSPRSKHLPAIAELRKIGKREARARLEKLNGGSAANA
jgi:DNA-binding XRE family transcriptional regulator